MFLEKCESTYLKAGTLFLSAFRIAPRLHNAISVFISPPYLFLEYYNSTTRALKSIGYTKEEIKAHFKQCAATLIKNKKDITSFEDLRNKAYALNKFFINPTQQKIIKDKTLTLSKDISCQFKNEFLSAWETVRPEYKSFLQRHDIKIHGERTARNRFPDNIDTPIFNAHKDTHARTHLDHMGALFIKQNKNQKSHIFFFEYTLRPGIHPSDISAPTPEHILKNDWFYYDTDISPDMHHEMAHAIDIHAAPQNTRLSNTQGFKTAYQKDLEKLGGKDQAKQIKEILYYLNDDEEVSCGELFADLWATTEKQCNHPLTHGLFPHSYAWVKTFTRQHKAALKKGPKKEKAFRRIFAKSPHATGLAKNNL